MAPYVVCIDGLIGAGKTSLLARLHSVYPCFPEPLSAWTFLPYLYSQPSHYGFPFHVQVLLSQFHQRQHFPDDSIVLVERCPWTSRHVFAPLLLSPDDLALYDVLYHRFAYPVDLFVYLSLPPEDAFHRLQTRSPLDTAVTLPYLRQLHAQYLSTLILGRSNLCVVDATAPGETVAHTVSRLLATL